MGLSEAFMKIFPDIKLKDSNISSVFVPLGKKEDISRYLLRADPELTQSLTTMKKNYLKLMAEKDCTMKNQTGLTST